MEIIFSLLFAAASMMPQVPTPPGAEHAALVSSLAPVLMILGAVTILALLPPVKRGFVRLVAGSESSSARRAPVKKIHKAQTPVAVYSGPTGMHGASPIARAHAAQTSSQSASSEPEKKDRTYRSEIEDFNLSLFADTPESEEDEEDSSK